MKNQNNILALLTLALALPGALHAFSQEKDGIKISVKDFTNDPYAQVIDNPSWTITAEDLQKNNIAAMTVKITNNTDKPICISGRSVRFSQAKINDIAEKLKKRTIIRPILTYFGGLLITGQLIEAIMPPPKFRDYPEMIINDNQNYNKARKKYDRESPLLFNTAWLTCLAGSIVYGFYLSNLNHQLEILLKQSSLNEATIIAPKQSVEKIIFCEGILNQNFNFSIFNDESFVSVADFAVDLCA